MKYPTRYIAAKAKLLSDPAICPENHALFAKFFEYEEYKLKRMNGLTELDANSYKTLLDYVTRLRTVDRWFNGKSWEQLTREDIKAVYDRIEDGQVLTRFGRPFKAKETYYRKIMRGQPFKMAGKYELVRQVMEFHPTRQKEEVRFIREDAFRKLVAVATRIDYKLMLWLGWDIGENMTSLLQLRPSDCIRQTNPNSGQPEYHITLRREILKRSRTPRTEITNYDETVALLDDWLRSRPVNEPLFTFGYPTAVKVLKRAVRLTEARCIPGGQPVTLKDLRSSMACDLLSKGWTTDEVNQRLGHKPSSREIDKYVNWLALNRHQPKRRMHEANVSALSQQLDELRTREKLQQQRLQAMQNQVVELREQIETNNRLMFEELKRLVNQSGAERRPMRDALTDDPATAVV